MPLNTRKEVQTYLEIINYLSTFTSGIAELCDLLSQLTYIKAEWMWNSSYQALSDKGKLIIKEDTCMKFYQEAKPLYSGTDTSGLGLAASLLQTRDYMSSPKDEGPDQSILRPITVASKRLSATERKVR